ncbi:MAG: aconitate hydratase [Thermoprotei archaeon]
MSEKGPEELRQRALSHLNAPHGTIAVYSLRRLLGDSVSHLPYAVRMMAENALRNGDEDSTIALINWKKNIGKPIRLWPTRIILQDATGIPVLVDLAALRDEVRRRGADPLKVNPAIPVNLVVDHSIKVDYFGSWDAAAENAKLELKRNEERFTFLRWAEKAFRNFEVVPPGKGIIHQVNMEHFSKVITQSGDGSTAFPEMLLGTDSHTTMASALGYLAWGVGGLEAEEAMLGQPYTAVIPEVIGVRLVGELKGWATATDLALFITQKLRKSGVVAALVEFFGPAARTLPVPDRAALSNMAPEYGATTALFPIDEQTLSFLKTVGKGDDQVTLVRDCAKEMGIFADDPEPDYSRIIEVDLSDVEPSISGPSRPDQRMPLGSFGSSHGMAAESMQDGFVALAAITSCTNTSNPWLMIAAAMLAKEAVKRGLTVKPWVKTSFAPGSPAVLAYLERAGLIPYLEALRFHVTGFGCTVCIGNSGPLLPQAEEAIGKGLKGVSVISGNRNFPYRIHPLIASNYLASPPLVIAYAIAGTINVDLNSEPMAIDPNGRPVFLRDLMPPRQTVDEAVRSVVRADDFKSAYSSLAKGSEDWSSLRVSTSALFSWDRKSTFIRPPPLFASEERGEIEGARALLVLGDDVNTDMISPAGEIPVDSDAGRYLVQQGVSPEQLGTYLSRRGNHEVMVRGTFAHPSVKNALAGGRTGPWTAHLPDGQIMSVFEAAQKYISEHVPLIIIAGERYGSGSSRDWAAKGPALLGVRAVMAASFERIHLSNLISVGILPLQVDAHSLRVLSGKELFSVRFPHGLSPGCDALVTCRDEKGSWSFVAKARLDTLPHVERYKAGGILPLVLARYTKSSPNY